MCAAAIRFLDYVLTTILSLRFGYEGEKNPILRHLIGKFGILSI